jgi:glutathione S-transferase
MRPGVFAPVVTPRVVATISRFYLGDTRSLSIPAIVDHEPGDGRGPLSVFESGAILLYLARKSGQLLPRDARGRIEALLADGRPRAHAGPESSF